MEQLAGILPLILIFVVFYFLLIRPQQKKLKDHKKMISDLKKGDRVVTQGGIIGSIHYVNDDGTLSVEIADNVIVMAKTLVTKSLKEAGAYSGVMPIQKHKDSLKFIAKIKK